MLLSMLLASLVAAAKPAPPPARDALVGELVTEGALPKRVSKAPADLVIFYGGEHKGSLETCGCPKRPRGSFARLDAYVDASRGANPGVASVLVNAGYWIQDGMGFDGTPRADIAIGNRYMIEGIRATGWDALNVSFQDVAGLMSLPPDGGPPLPLVSANVAGPGLNRWVIIERDGQRVGITGITGLGQTLTETPGYTTSPPASAGAVLDALAEQVDTIVLLSYQATEEAKSLAQSHPAVDVVIDAARHQEFEQPFYVGKAAWVFSHFQTMRLGELRLNLEKGRVVGGVSRSIDLDPEVPDDPALLTLTKKARTELDKAQQDMYGP